MNIFRYFRGNIAVWIFLLFFWCIGLGFLALYRFDTVASHLFINQFTSNSLDHIMKYTTHLGDGFVMLALIGVFFFISTRYFLNFLLTGIFLLPSVYFLKNFFAHPRPLSVFADAERLHELYVPLQEYINMAPTTFPSGHASVSFAMGVTLALLSQQVAQQFLWLLLAAFVSASRVYLSQHFLEDVIFGSFLGSFAALIAYRILGNWQLNQVRVPLFTWWKQK